MKKTSIKEIEGAFVFEFDRFEDERGYFQEVQSEKHGVMNYAWQTNVSCSSANVIRGMHVAPFGKLCTCIRGSLWDVVADVREGSPTYGNWFGVWLMEDNCKQLYIPSGCAHGFYSKCDRTMLLYSQDQTYNPDLEAEINWLDPTLDIKWPEADKYILSDKDKNAKFL